jgi:hypothetical protein
MTGELSFVRPLSGPNLQPSPSYGPATIYAALERAGVSEFYPGFQPWFFNQVVPGLYNGQRRIITIELEGELAGVAICKCNDLERKLCTLWVPPMLRVRGLAGELACRAFNWLDTDRPVFTVPEERFVEFEGLVRYWGFPAPTALPNLYRKGRTEYVFNGSSVGRKLLL